MSDLSLDEEKFYLIGELLELESHIERSIGRVKDKNLVKLLNEIWRERAQLLDTLIPETQNKNEDDAEEDRICIGKHTIRSTIRSLEVGAKLSRAGLEEDAIRAFELAENLKGLFFTLKGRWERGATPKVKRKNRRVG